MRQSLALLVSFLLSVVFFGARLAKGAEVTVKEEKPGLLAKAKVTADVATPTAHAMVPKAKLASAEIEEENGKLIYSFDFKTEGKRGIDEVNVDAMNGDVLAVEHESPRVETKEKAADTKKGLKKRH